MSNVIIAAEFSHVNSYDGKCWDNTPIEGGNHYDYSSLVAFADKDNPPDMWAEIPYTAHGDYVGHGDVGLANYRCIEEEFTDHNDIAFISGDYGFGAVIYRTNTKDTEILDMLKNLKNYPLLDENIHSEVELEWQNEAWECWARSDFKRALIKKFTIVPEDMQSRVIIAGNKAWQTLVDKIEDAIDDLDDDKVYEIFNVACEDSNTYWEAEQSGSYIDIDRVIKAVEWSDLGITSLEDK